MAHVSAVDLFCGAGGLTRGLLDAGILVRAGYDLDPACRHAYETNNAPAVFRETDVADITSADIRSHFDGDFSLLAGCAPCQPFSLLTQGRLSEEDRRWSLLAHFQRLAVESLPDYVTMENVPGLARTDLFRDFRIALEDCGYHVDARVVECAGYGVPQHRNRVVLIAARSGPISVPPANEETVACGPLIAGLPPVAAGGTCETDRVHRAPTLRPINQRRIQASQPGNSWSLWPAELRLECHQRGKGTSYKDAYGRIDPNKPAPTITTKFHNYGSGRFGHPTQDRALTPREAAILQTFPPDYVFDDEEQPLKLGDLGRLIGNAVPVRLGYVVGRTILDHAGKA